MIIKGNLISEGKAKSLFETENQQELMMVYRDDTSAFDGKKKEALKGKGEINNIFNAHIMDYLANNGIDTHYIKTISKNESLVHRLDMLPVECVVSSVTTVVPTWMYVEAKLAGIDLVVQIANVPVVFVHNHVTILSYKVGHIQSHLRIDLFYFFCFFP